MSFVSTFLNKMFLSLHGREVGLFRLQLRPSLRDNVLAGSDLHGVLVSTEDNISSSGSTQSGAYQLTSFSNRLGTVASGSGVMLPPMQPGMNIFIANDDAANAGTVYPSTLEPQTTTIDGVAAATGVVITHAKRDIFTCFNVGTIVSLGTGKST